MITVVKNRLDNKALLRSFAVLLLLVLYSVASLRIDSLHQFFHSRNIVELHSAEQERNPCHKNIYHQQREAGCKHQSHLTENAKCPLCEFKISSDEWLTTPGAAPHAFQLPAIQFYYPEEIPSPSLFLLSGRSPPQHV